MSKYLIIIFFYVIYNFLPHKTFLRTFLIRLYYKYRRSLQLIILLDRRDLNTPLYWYFHVSTKQPSSPFSLSRTFEFQFTCKRFWCKVQWSFNSNLLSFNLHNSKFDTTHKWNSCMFRDFQRLEQLRSLIKTQSENVWF